MRVSVWDTYVTKKDGTVMHFDIIVPEHIKDETLVYSYGRRYLESKNEASQSITSKECRYCHVEQATSEMESSISKMGYYILEMQNCK